MSASDPHVEIARAALAVARGHAAPVGDEIKQMLADAELGRKLREAAEAEPDEIMHIGWWDPDRSRMDGIFMGDTHLHGERAWLAKAAEDLIEAAGEGEHS